MPKWPFLLPQYCGFSTVIRFVQICLKHVRMDKYVGSSEILWMTLWGITASTSSRKTFVVAIMSPVKRLMPVVRLVEPVSSVLLTFVDLVCSCSPVLSSPVSIVDLLVWYVRFLSSPVTVVNLLDKVF